MHGLSDIVTRDNFKATTGGKTFIGETQMAMKILEDCISCGACVPECPTESITEGDTIYVINTDTCVECVGHFDSPSCVSVCPVECIVQA